MYQFPEIFDTWNILNHVDYFPNIQNAFKKCLICCIFLSSMQNCFCVKLSHISFVTNGLLVKLNCCKLKFLWVAQVIIYELPVTSLTRALSISLKM